MDRTRQYYRHLYYRLNLITHIDDQRFGALIVEIKCIAINTSETSSLQWRHNERNGVWNHRCLHCLCNCCFRRRSKKISKLRLTGLCAGNSPVTGEFPTRKTSNAENGAIWWRHYVWTITHVTLVAVAAKTIPVPYPATETRWKIMYFT